MKTGTDNTSPEYALRLSEAERARYRMMAKQARELEADLWTAAGVVPGATVADIGCGPGAILVVLGELVGPTGSVTGVEPDPDAREAAEEEIAKSGLTNARVIDGDGTATGLDPSSLDVVMIRHVLFHVGARAQAVVDHLATLLRPGGSLYAVDVEMSASQVSPADPDFVDSMTRYLEFQRARGCNVDVGPQLVELLSAAGLEISERASPVITIPCARFALGGGPLIAAKSGMLDAGVASDADFERWEASRRRLGADPEAMMHMHPHVAVGRRPVVAPTL